MTARARLTLYLAAFLVGLLGVGVFHRHVEELGQKDYASILLDHGFEEIGQN